jgi:replicative DNA helicase
MSGKSRKGYLQYQLDQKTPEELKELSAEIDDRIFGEQVLDNTKTELIAVGELADEAKELVKNWGKMQGLSTGIKGVDYNMRGLVGGELIIIAGETSNGKTALGVNIAANVAMQGNPVLFVTLEITQAQLAARVAKLLPDDDALLQLPLLMQKQDELDWRDIDELIAVAIEEGIKLVVIDHLHYFTREVDKLAEDLGRITKQFKKNAIRHKIPVVLISHVRKKEAIKTPELSNDALRGSSLIAQDADVVLFVHKVSDDRVIVKTTKNRNRGYNFENDTVELEFTEGAVLKDVKEVFDDPFGSEK